MGHVYLDGDAEIVLGIVDARLDGNNHSGLQRRAVLAGVVNVQADMMAEAVNEIRAERFAMEIFSVGVDVIVGEFVDAFVAFGTVIRARLERADRSILRTENGVVDFARPR